MSFLFLYLALLPWQELPVLCWIEVVKKKISLPCFSSRGKAFSLSPSKKTLALQMSCVCVCVCVCVHARARSVAQSCPTLCDPLDCSSTGSSVHRIFQARKQEWAAISSSREPHRCPISRWSSLLFLDCWAFIRKGC